MAQEPNVDRGWRPVRHLGLLCHAGLWFDHDTPSGPVPASMRISSLQPRIALHGRAVAGLP